MKVSVSVVTYNQQDYIKQCLDGILKQQTNFEFEIILGEDESTDGTREICIEYANKYPEIKLFLRRRENVIYINGNATGRNNFIENVKVCQGEFIALCEGDDYWTDPLKLQKQVDFLENNQTVNICFHKVKVLKNDNFNQQRLLEKFIGKPFKYIELIRHFNFIATASVVFRKPRELEFPSWFCDAVFGDLTLYKLVSNGNDFYCLNKCMAVYRVHEKGLYSGISRQSARLNYIQFLKIIFPYLNHLEKYEAKIKIKAIRNELCKLRFPNRWLLQRVYYIYLILANKL